MKTLDPPDLDAADQAQQTVSGLADTLETDADSLQGLDESGGGTPGLLDRISAITTTLGSMASAVGGVHRPAADRRLG